MCSRALKLQKEINESLLVPDDDDDDTNDTRVFMPQNNSYAVAKYLRQEKKNKARAQKPKNIVNNYSVAQETSIEKGSTETVQDTQTSEQEISNDAALQIIPNELYNHIAWMITNASEQVDKSGRVKLTEKEKKQVLNVAQDLMAQVYNNSANAKACRTSITHI